MQKNLLLALGLCTLPAFAFAQEKSVERPAGLREPTQKSAVIAVPP